MIPLTCIILLVFILAEVFKQIFLALLLRHSDQHLSVSNATVFQITLESIKGRGIITFFIFDQLERRDRTLTLSDADIQAVTRESEQQFPTLRQVLTIQVDGVCLKEATHHQR